MNAIIETRARQVRKHLTGCRNPYLEGIPTWPVSGVPSRVATDPPPRAACAECITCAGGGIETLVVPNRCTSPVVDVPSRVATGRTMLRAIATCTTDAGRRTGTLVLLSHCGILVERTSHTAAHTSEPAGPGVPRVNTYASIAAHRHSNGRTATALPRNALKCVGVGRRPCIRLTPTGTTRAVLSATGGMTTGGDS